MSSEALARASLANALKKLRNRPLGGVPLLHSTEADALLAEVARLEQERDDAREEMAEYRDELHVETQRRSVADAALAVAREREQRAQVEADTYRNVAQFHKRKRDAAEAALAAMLDERLRSQPGVNPDGTVSTSSMAECVARAALVDEPAAAGEVRGRPVDESARQPARGSDTPTGAAPDEPAAAKEYALDNQIVGKSTLTYGDLRRSASAAADDGRCPGCGWYVADCNCVARAAADEPGETQHMWQHICRTLIQDAAPSWLMRTPVGEPCSECGKTEDEARGGVSPSGKERGE